jgi:hypothetical protein
MRNRILCQRLQMASALLLGSLLASFSVAQSQNPFQVFKDALNKAVQPQKNAQPVPNQPAQSQTAQSQSSSSSPAAPTQVASSGTNAPWTPPSDTPTAPVGPLDPAKLPDVGGIHIGATSAEVPAILKKLHPGVAVQTLAGGPAPLLFGASQTLWIPVPQSGDAITVNYTYEAGKPQAVYFLFRTVRYLEPVAKANLIDGLRKKYGHETLADMSGSRGPTTNDADIQEMYWLFDEQGHVVHPGNPDPGHIPYGCQGDYAVGDGGNTYRNMIRDYTNGQQAGGQPLAAATFCDSLIVLHMIIDGYEGNSTNLVKDTRTVLLDRALLRRSAIAIGSAQKAQAQKQRQNEQNQANQAKPNL